MTIIKRPGANAMTSLGDLTQAMTLPEANSANKGMFYKVIEAAYDCNPGDLLLSDGTTWVKIDNSDSVTSVNSKTGAVVLNSGDVGLSNVDNTSDLNKPISTSTQTALDTKQPTLVSGTTIKTLNGGSLLGSGDIIIEGQTATTLGLGNVDNTSDLNKPISTATQTALDLKANLASPTFTGTVSGITASMVGLGNVDNTSDLNKPISTATQTALDLKANLASPTFTGTVSGITKAMVGLVNVDNTSDINKPISTAQETRYQTIEAVNVTQDNRLTALEGSYWQDMFGDVAAKTTGGTAPTLGAFRGGNCQAWFYGANNTADFDYHFPHDYTLGTDLFLHLHWGHNGTAISGNLVVQVSMTWAKGHNQDIFPAELVFNMTIPATDLTVAPRWGHVVSEVQISAATPSAVQFNSGVFEPDGKLRVNAKVITNPTITGGSSTSPYWMGFDVHYLSTGQGTLNKAPNFYA